MTPGAIAVLSLSMSTDAFAAAVGRGAAHRPQLAQALRAGLIFGVIEAATPVVGWSLGLIAAGVVQQIDHWIAFVLLAGVGAHMVWHGVRPRREDQPPARLNGRFRRPLAGREPGEGRPRPGLSESRPCGQGRPGDRASRSLASRARPGGR